MESRYCLSVRSSLTCAESVMSWEAMSDAILSTVLTLFILSLTGVWMPPESLSATSLADSPVLTV